MPTALLQPDNPRQAGRGWRRPLTHDGPPTQGLAILTSLYRYCPTLSPDPADVFSFAQHDVRVGAELDME